MSPERSAYPDIRNAIFIGKVGGAGIPKGPVMETPDGSTDRIVHFGDLREIDAESREKMTAARIEHLSKYKPILMILEENPIKGQAGRSRTSNHQSQAIKLWFRMLN